MTVVAWLFSLSCSGPGSLSAAQISFLEWMIYILFSPCGHHILQASIHVLFFFIVCISAPFQKRLTQQQQQQQPQDEHANKVPGRSTIPGPLFIITLLLLSLISLLSLAFLVWHIWNACTSTRWTSISISEVVVAAIQSFAWITFTSMVFHEQPKQLLEHPRPLRAWWFVIALLTILQSASAIIRIAGYGFSYSDPLRVNDIVSIIILPVSLFLLVVSATGATGLRERETFGGRLAEPLLNGGEDERKVRIANVTGYYKAGLFSRALWMWLNPVLSKGAETTLEIEDIPELPPDDEAERLYSLLQSNWLSDIHSSHPSRTAIINSFKWQFIFTGFLVFCKSVSTYVGPTLIQSFSDLLESSPRYYSEGFMLVFILLLSKGVQLLSTHHYQFLSGKLGMSIRSCLTTSIYRKGLKLSNSSRLSHGTGQIVNYMTVDVQQISDSIVQLHNVWTLPLQILLALFILYREIGIAMFAGLAAMLVIVGVIAINSTLIKKYSIEVLIEKDSRMRATTEVLNNMKIIKLQAWEEYFRKKVEACRQKEYNCLAKLQFVFAANLALLSMSISVVSLVAFAVYLLLDTEFSAAKAFTVISVFNLLSEPIRLFPQAIIAVFQALVSLHRLDKYFLSGELEGYVKRDSPSEPGHCIIVEQGMFTWDEKESNPILSDINLKVPQGQFVAIVGTVGAGKSSLLAALLGEMPKLNGRVEVHGTTAYVPQTAWIQSGTVQENILFGLPMDHAKYQDTLRGCALEQDIKMFEFGDQTEIGERGITLSGGQKQRIQLARAVYQDSDVYFLDDIFSAVDAHTGSALFKDCLLGALKEKTRILVTHQVEFLHNADLILVVQNGIIEQSGTYSDLLQAGAEFEALVVAHNKALGAVDVLEPLEELVQVEDFADDTAPIGPCTEAFESMKLVQRLNSQEHLMKRLSSGSLSRSNAKEGPGKLVEDEKRESGRVGCNVYWLFLTSALGVVFIFLLLAAQIISQAFSLCSSFWISYETLQTSFNAGQFIIVYLLLSVANWVFTILQSGLSAIFGLKSPQSFYIMMLRSIFRAPMSFFDSTPTGRILTRASSDQGALDFMLPLSIVSASMLIMLTLSATIVMCVVTWPVIFVILTLGWMYRKYQTFYIRSSREISRLDSITRAPVIHHFTETITGFMVIRGFRKEEDFIKINLDRVNTNLKMDFHAKAANDWFGCRLELLGSFVLCVAALMLVVLPSSTITPAMASLSLSYGLMLNSSLAATVFLGCMIENKMVAVERIRQYTTLPSEAALTIEGSVPNQDWPESGNINIRNLRARYQPTMPLVLKGISLDIIGGQKIGVVGRTGSGKSTLIQVFFRIIEPVGGSILFDGIDITFVGLHDLRSRLGIIPQDPVLFQGTIRTNMDPLNAHTDVEIWQGLRKCQLAGMVESRSGKLDAKVESDGENWSVGQRQLLCLGRALLKKSHILFLDEATASVDAQTDAALQTIIREEFQRSTVVSIAHRIPSVMDCDKVMVLEAGYVKEYDSPAMLLENNSTLFAALVHEYMERSRGRS